MRGEPLHPRPQVLRVEQRVVARLERALRGQAFGREADRGGVAGTGDAGEQEAREGRPCDAGHFSWPDYINAGKPSNARGAAYPGGHP